jgi:hypothetical protein
MKEESGRDKVVSEQGHMAHLGVCLKAKIEEGRESGGSEGRERIADGDAGKMAEAEHSRGTVESMRRDRI